MTSGKVANSYAFFTIHPLIGATLTVVELLIVIPVYSYVPVEITLPSRIFLSISVNVRLLSSLLIFT